MDIPLKERIAQRAKSKGSRPQNRVFFLALMPDIAEALESGWSVKSIYETLFEEKKISFSYKTFREYVNKYILKEEKPPKVQKEHQKPSEAFIFNPTINEKELI